MTPEQHDNFSTGSKFLKDIQISFDEFSLIADDFSSKSGKKLPATMESLGSVLSIIYRLACCAWGCKGGDHQVEWLLGKITNQASSALRLIRAGLYDEALSIVRGTGEIANLIWLFASNLDELESWKTSDSRVRKNTFSPYSVRMRLEEVSIIGPPIDKDRYSKLCDVGIHPTPKFAPGHYNGTGRPILGCVIQPAGVYVAMTELGYAVAMCAVHSAKLVDAPDDIQLMLKDESVKLIKSLGGFTILNYENLLAQALDEPE